MYRLKNKIISSKRLLPPIIWIRLVKAALIKWIKYNLLIFLTFFVVVVVSNTNSLSFFNFFIDLSVVIYSPFYSKFYFFCLKFF